VPIVNLNESFENNVAIIKLLIAAKVKRSFRFGNLNSDVPIPTIYQQPFTVFKYYNRFAVTDGMSDRLV